MRGALARRLWDALTLVVLVASLHQILFWATVIIGPAQ